MPKKEKQEDKFVYTSMAGLTIIPKDKKPAKENRQKP